MPENVLLDAEETTFFKGLRGTMLAIPAVPFHRNTYHQLRWVACPDLYLLNGYSARSTARFDRLMLLERRHGKASAPQMACAVESGAQYVCLWRGRVPVTSQEQLQDQYRTLFANDRFLVLALAPPSP